MLVLQTPGATGFFGCIGKDDFGKELKECVAADGVNAFYKEDDEAPTGACMCARRGRQRRDRPVSL